MNSLSVLGKYLDQPMLVAKFSKSVPAMLTAGGGVLVLSHVLNSPKEERKKEAIKSLAVFKFTVISALLATRGIKPFKIGKKLFKGFEGLSERIDLNGVKEQQTKFIDAFLKTHPNLKSFEALTKAKKNVLSFSEIKSVFEELTPKNKDFLDTFIPNPEKITSKDIFSEIGRLSLMGLIPIFGGILGGIIGDKLTEKDWKDRIPNKIKEGTYQYFANIFLCNVGAGAALLMLEKAKVTSKSARAAGMIGGILLAGVAFGSAIANLIGKTFVDPIFAKEHQHGHNHGLYSERKPEVVDVGLHIDDVATVAVLSGLKWIEPALPMLYSISGYRAGIGYRNGEKRGQEG